MEVLLSIRYKWADLENNVVCTYAIYVMYVSTFRIRRRDGAKAHTRSREQQSVIVGECKQVPIAPICQQCHSLKLAGMSPLRAGMLGGITGCAHMHLEALPPTSRRIPP